MFNVLNELLSSKLFLKIQKKYIEELFPEFQLPEVEETISIFNSCQLLLNQRVQRDIKHKAS